MPACSLAAGARPLFVALMLGAALTAAACAQEPREQDPAPQRKPEALIADILERYHGPLKGTFDNAIVELRTEAKGKPTRVSLALPRRMKVDSPNKTVDILLDGEAWTCPPMKAPRKLEGDARAGLDTLRQHLRGIMLIPLYRAKQIKRAGPGVLSLIAADGETWRLEVVEKDLELVELRGPAGAVRFLSFLDTGLTKHASLVELPKLGKRHVRFVASNLHLGEKMFRDPIERGASGNPTGMPLSVHNDFVEKPRLPEVQTLPEREYLVLEDPGNWSRRRSLLMREGRFLARHGQRAHGLPTYLLRDSTQSLLIPFRPRTPNKPAELPKSRKTMIVASHRAAVVVPPLGPWDEVLTRGRKMLQKLLEKENLQATGPMRAIPFLTPEVLPTDQQLRKLEIRLELPVKKKGAKER